MFSEVVVRDQWHDIHRLGTSFWRPLLTLHVFYNCFSVFIVEFEQLNAGWVRLILWVTL